MRSSDPSDEEKLLRHARALEAGLRRHLRRWVDDTLTRRLGHPPVPRQSALIDPAVERALDDLGVLLATDIDRQPTNPLALVRSLVGPMTAVLLDAGVPAPPRDADAVRLFPDDHYDLTPGAFADVAPELHELGLVWGAAKAHVHLRRRRAEGLIR